jgi:hypothetical protein
MDNLKLVVTLQKRVIFWIVWLIVSHGMSQQRSQEVSAATHAQFARFDGSGACDGAPLLWPGGASVASFGRMSRSRVPLQSRAGLEISPFWECSSQQDVCVIWEQILCQCRLEAMAQSLTMTW